MTPTHLRPDVGTRPLVAVLCSVPLLGEALRSTLEFAEVRSFAADGDVKGLLESLRPDAVVVDGETAAEAAALFADASGIPVVHIRVRTRTLRLRGHGAWTEIAGDEGPTPDLIRNAVAGCLFAREPA